MRPAIFFDRDGVLNEDSGFPHKPEHIRWCEGAVAALRLAHEKGYLVFVVTNQSGVARGLYTENDVKNLHAWMKAELQKQGAGIDDFAYCPHHPTEGQGSYKVDCACRKPKAGMILGLIEKYAVDASKSFLIGDRDSDMEAAKASGLKGVLYQGGDVAKCLQTLIDP